MKKLFTLAIVLSVAISAFAQVKTSFKDVKLQKQESVIYTGMEEISAFESSVRSIVENPVETELAQTYYDWQTNTGLRNFIALWPDGYAVACYTEALESDYSDRGTGLSIFDPAVGEWTFTEGRVESEKTGFGSIARYGENGLVVAAHTSSTLMFIINEDFRNGGEWSEPVYLTKQSGVYDPCWPVVQCSGENNDIIHLLYTNNAIEVGGVTDPILYSRYANGAFEVEHQQLDYLSREYAADLGSNVVYFMPYDEARPDRVSFIVNAAWSDGRLVISEDNGQTWSERMFFKHPDFNTTYPTDVLGFYYPRWVSAAFDGEDNLHIAYSYNGTNAAAGDGYYYASVGGIAYWSEILPKNEMCLGGIGEVGQPFVIDTTYISQDLYQSEWYWSDALHESLPEYVGQMEVVDSDGNVLPRDAAEGYWPIIGTGGWDLHGKYNSGKADFPTIIYDNNSDMVCVIWSQICGNSEAGIFFDGTNHFYRLFCNASFDGGNTWEGTRAVLADFVNMYDEMVYPVVIPYVYSDASGKYIQMVYQNDQEPGTYVQGDESKADNNFYRAVRIDIEYLSVEENDAMIENINMSVYPNPAMEGEINIQLNGESKVSIYNTVGQLVETFVFDGVKSVDVSDYASGVYFIKADNGNVSTTQKVIVK